MKFLELLETYEKVDVKKVKEIIAEKEKKLKEIIKECFAVPFTSPTEAISIIEKDYLTSNTTSKNVEFIKENKDWVVNKIKNLTESEIKIIINNYENGSKVDKVKADNVELETEGKKRGRGRPPKSGTVQEPKDTEIVDKQLIEDVPNEDNDEELDQLETEDSFPTEPEDEDITIADISRGGYDVGVVNGKFIGHFSDYDEALEAIKEYQKGSNFYPNIWNISDHGNAMLINDKGEEIKECTKTLPEKKLNETGEMSKYDIEKGGEDYGWATAIKDAVKKIAKNTNGKVKFEEIRPFDKYQGPYAVIKINGKFDKLWTTDNEDEYYIERLDIKGSIFELSEAINGDEEVMKICKKNVEDERSKEYKVKSESSMREYSSLEPCCESEEDETVEEGDLIDLKPVHLDKEQYEVAKKSKDFKVSDWKWDDEKQLYTAKNLEEAKDEDKEPRLQWLDIVDDNTIESSKKDKEESEDEIIITDDPKIDFETGDEEENSIEDIIDIDDEKAEADEEQNEEPEVIEQGPKEKIIDIVKEMPEDKLKLIAKLLKKSKDAKVDVEDIISSIDKLEDKDITQLLDLLSGTNSDEVVEELPDGDVELETKEEDELETPEDEKEEEKE